MQSQHRLVLAAAAPLAVAGVLAFATGAGEEPTSTARFPVPREQSVIIETDMKFDVPDIVNGANPLKAYGTVWGSGWHQVVNEWDWYYDYATGERILWRTTGWEYSPDYMQLTWHIRKGVTWNDGVPYTAQDIVFTYQLLMKHDTLVGAGSAANVDSVSAPDDYTVIFKFRAPDYRFHQNLRMWGGAAIVAKHIYEKQDPEIFTNWPPVETGSYKLQGWYENNAMYIWESDPDYWGTKVMGKKPGPKYVIYRSAPPPDFDLEEFVQGNVDMPLPHIFTIDMIRAAEKRWTHTVRSPYMDAVSTGIGSFNTARAPTSDREFRWALQYLLNREKLRRIYPQADSTAVTMWPWPDWKTLDHWEVPAVRDKYGPMLKYDAAAAERELDRLGYRKGSDGLRRLPDGKPFTLLLVSSAAPDFNNLIAVDFSDELRKVGIDNVVKARDISVPEGEQHILFDVIDGSIAFANDPFAMIDAYAGKWAKPIGEVQSGGDWGLSRLNDPTLDAIGEEMARMTPDDPRYIDLVGRALDRWYYDLPAVPAVEKTFVQTMSDRYWTNWPTPGRMYQVPYTWGPTLFFILFEIKPVK